MNNEEILNNGEKETEQKEKILCEIEEKKCFIVTVFYYLAKLLQANTIA